jgi:hypothetical protein
LSDAIDEDEQAGGDGSGLKHKMDILRLKMEKVHLDRKVCHRNLTVSAWMRLTINITDIDHVRCQETSVVCR